MQIYTSQKLKKEATSSHSTLQYSFWSHHGSRTRKTRRYSCIGLLMSSLTFCTFLGNH